MNQIRYTAVFFHRHLSACQWNKLGGPDPFEARVITDLGHTGDLTPEKQLSTCWKYEQMFR